ncbi:MAG: hypothetical protein AAF391_06870 [Bacteroidota bacterium]
MKNLVIIPFLMVGLASAQTSTDSFTFTSYNVGSEFMKRILSIEIPRRDFTADFSPVDQPFSEFQSDVRIITPDQFMLTNYPDRDFSNMTELFMGTTTTQSFLIGNKKVTQTYLFDLNGTLRSSQLSISFGKDK